MDILRLALGSTAQIQRVHLHEHLLITLLLPLHIDKLGTLVKVILLRPLLNLGLELSFCFSQLVEIDSRSLTFGVGFQIDFTGHGDSSRHGLRTHVNSLVELGGGGRFPNTLGGLGFEILEEPVHAAFSPIKSFLISRK